MKCPKCGKEIANDSNFCEFCGSPVGKNSEKNKKARITLGVILVSLVGLAFLLIPHYNQTHVVAAEEPADSTVAVYSEYIDLGLPSGTLWKEANETDKYYTYEEAVDRFGDQLPTKEQCEELKDKCQWTWNGSGYEVTGPNGNSIFLPVAGYRDCDGDVRVAGSYGGYWSSTPGGSEEAWSLSFDSGGVYMGSDYRCLGRSVRLVQD